MARDLNVVMLVGRIGQDLELKTTSNGSKQVSFSLAVGDDYTKDGKKVEKTNWLNCVVYGASAENLAKYCGKGSQVAVKGKLTADQVEKDGQKRTYYNVVCESVQFLGSKGGETPQKSASEDTEFEVYTEYSDDEF